MSRSGYSDDYDYDGDILSLGRWRAQVASAIRGKRGQAFLREMVEALDAMPVKRLIVAELQQADGEVCAIGSVGVKRGLDMSGIDPDDPPSVAAAFGIAHQLVAEIEYENDEAVWSKETPEQRWQRMRDWAARQIKQTPPNP